MAMIQSWELSQYQFAAEHMCYRFGEAPYEQLMDDNGQHFPRWVIYAERMHEMRVLVEVMSQHGISLTS